MEENLLGYLLNSLDDATQQEVEGYLRGHPEAQVQLARLRRALEPLEADRDGLEPPPGLWVRTLACVAEHGWRELAPRSDHALRISRDGFPVPPAAGRDLPKAPALPLNRAPAPPRRWWRRADVLIAACLLLGVLGLMPPAVGRLRERQQLAACQNNLRELGSALLRYCDLDHSPEPDHFRGAFPNVAQHARGRNVAGLFVPTLVEAGVLQPEQANVNCPALGPAVHPRWRLSELMNLPREEFERRATELAPAYAYSLGYSNGAGQIIGLCQNDGLVPIVADRPPADPVGLYNVRANSANHNGRGQNVLFTDGHVRFQTVRGYDGDDDIFLNEVREAAAGLHPRDFVLGASSARPKPTEPPQD